MSDPRIDDVLIPDAGVAPGEPARVTIRYRTDEDTVLTASSDGAFEVRLLAASPPNAGADGPVKAPHDGITVDAWLVVTRKAPGLSECEVTFTLGSADEDTRVVLVHVRA